MHSPTDVPCVLIFAGLDPTGGAGLQADQEALSSMGCHPCPIATSLTSQDTSNVQAQYPVSTDIIREQFETLVKDIPIAGVKIGLLSDVSIAKLLIELLAELPDVPVVMDPVLSASGGTLLADEALQAGIRDLLPQITLLTPNQGEAEKLTGIAEPNEQAKALHKAGCELVLITGGDADTQQVENVLYDQQGAVERFQWERLPGLFHGTGCTLSSAICGLLAQGQAPKEAIAEAQRYTWETLYEAYAIGKGQAIPNRLFWAQQDDPECIEPGSSND